MDAEDDLSCRKASRLLSLACERPLDANELKALRNHLNECLMCTNFDKQLQFLHQAAERFGC
jgi:hypothetical protein